MIAMPRKRSIALAPLFPLLPAPLSLALDDPQSTKAPNPHEPALDRLESLSTWRREPRHGKRPGTAYGSALSRTETKPNEQATDAGQVGDGVVVIGWLRESVPALACVCNRSVLN
jgi:hypothetical protein